MYIDRLAPGARETLAEFREHDVELVMVSGGLRESILPLAQSSESLKSEFTLCRYFSVQRRIRRIRRAISFHTSERQAHGGTEMGSRARYWQLGTG